MITAAEIKAYAKAKGIDIEEYYPSTQYFNGISRTDYKYTIGIQFKKGVYYWWDNYIFDIRDFDCEVCFSHRYNQVNGAVQKSFNRGFTAERTIRKSLTSKTV